MRKPLIWSRIVGRNIAVLFCQWVCVLPHLEAWIPHIKVALGLSDGQLGTILFCVAGGSVDDDVFFGKTRDSFWKPPHFAFSILMYAFSLTNLGLAQNAWQLALGLYAFGIFGNLTNIAVNTQGVYTEGLFKRTIMSSFHGMWKFGRIYRALVGLGMLALDLSTYSAFSDCCFNCICSNCF